jgi:hypothetical protein
MVVKRVCREPRTWQAKNKVAQNSQELERGALNVGERNQKSKERKLNHHQNLELERWTFDSEEKQLKNWKKKKKKAIKVS